MESEKYRNSKWPHGYWNTGTWNDRWIIEDIFPGKRNGYFVDLVISQMWFTQSL